MKYSIITINFNNSNGLRNTIESVVNQTFNDFEYLIIDGGSTDGSVDVIKEYAEKISYWVSEPDKGIYNAMNKGIIKAHGEYLNFMNSGDCFNNKYILEKLDKYTADIIYGRNANLNKDGRIVSYSTKINNVNMGLFFITTLPHQSCFIKRNLFKNNLYDESLKIVGDWRFFMDAIVYHNHSVQDSNMIIANCECRGASSDMKQLIKEKNDVIKQIMPIGMYKDYEMLSCLGLSVYDELIYISKYSVLRNILHKLLRIIVLIHKRIIR